MATMHVTEVFRGQHATLYVSAKPSENTNGLSENMGRYPIRLAKNETQNQNSGSCHGQIFPRVEKC